MHGIWDFPAGRSCLPVPKRRRKNFLSIFYFQFPLQDNNQINHFLRKPIRGNFFVPLFHPYGFEEAIPKQISRTAERGVASAACIVFENMEYARHLTAGRPRSIHIDFPFCTRRSAVPPTRRPAVLPPSNPPCEHRSKYRRPPGAPARQFPPASRPKERPPGPHRTPGTGWISGRIR
jgi:hypothetical protein